jgi:hypothetical protein
MPRKMLFRDLSELRHCYWEGWPTARIARRLHVDRSVIRRILTENRLPRHTHLSADRYLAAERTEDERRLFCRRGPRREKTSEARWLKAGDFFVTPLLGRYALQAQPL